MRSILRRILTSRRTYIVLTIVIAVALLPAAIQHDYGCDMTGFGACAPAIGDPRPEKTLWDWLELLIVPTVLAIVGLVFTRQERANARTIAEQRRQDDTLRTYLDQMTELLLHESLRAPPPPSETRDVARLRTLIALRRLDQDHRAIVMHFLRDAKLVGLTDEEKIVTFERADLSEADLFGIDLSHISLNHVKLRRATLHGATLHGAILVGADLAGADLSYADLAGADLRAVTLHGADLRGFKLQGATLADTQLVSAASLSGAILPSGQRYTAEAKHQPDTNPPSSQDS